MKQLIILSAFFYSLVIRAESLIDEDNFMDYLSATSFFSASFVQKTYSNSMERKVIGQIKANRKGMFKLTYEEPMNEVIVSDGFNLHRFDPELEQLDIQALENLLDETPMGLFSSNSDALKKLFSVSSCVKSSEFLRCQLEAKSEESYLKTIVVQISNDLITGIRYVDAFDQNVLLKFSEISNKTILDNEFHFIIPEGIDIVRH
jgi:outer membrane lipoprotein carrier protein